MIQYSLVGPIQPCFKAVARIAGDRCVEPAEAVLATFAHRVATSIDTKVNDLLRRVARTIAAIDELARKCLSQWRKLHRDSSVNSLENRG